MCGIAGAYQQPDGKDLTVWMSERLAHRGPDAGGIYHLVDGRVEAHLAHRRLSIIDLTSGGDQPFSKDGLVLSYNGELYNYRQLRTELAARGVTFRSSSDTEVVLEAWRCWGPAALTRFRGMFAFALLDEGTGRLVLARDHLGVKPLFVLHRGDGIVFASELKAIVGALGSELEIDPGALIASMLYYWVPEQLCTIKGVQKLPPASWMECSTDGQTALHSYWDIAAAASEAAAGPAADLASVVERSVEAHLVADVPVSTFLSGGLDSSIITVLAKRANPAVDAYTIAFRPEDQGLEATPEDHKFARKVASQFGIDLHEIVIAPDIADLLPRMVDALDEPIGDAAAINTFLMCEAARDARRKVLLSGMGADELFGGYRKHYACLLAARYRRLPGPLRHGIVKPVVDRLPVALRGRGLRQVRNAKRFLSFAEMAEEPAFRRSYTLFAGDDLIGLLDPALGHHVGELFQQHAAIYHDTTLPDHVNRMCLADTRMFMTGLNLTYTDRASMAASTEVRVPFVDLEVFRAAFSFPGAAKISGRTAKAPLKAAAESWLPREIVYRPKASFSAPLRAWVSRDLRSMVDDVVLDGELVRSGFLRRREVETLIAEDRSGREDRSKQIWQLLTLELWCRQTRALGVRG